VIHSYTNPYNPYQLDPPTEGAIAFLHEAVKKFHVVIYSTRAKDQQGCDTISRWLGRHGAPADLQITDKKPIAIIFIDDRAWRFEGQFPTMDEIFAAATTWNKR
jgi:hypothetical protein